jgi:hypothetical protein
MWLSLTRRSQVALAGQSAGPWLGVVQVGVAGAGLAAGCRAGGGAGADQVPEPLAGPVPRLGVPVVAGALGDRLELDLQPGQELRQGRCLGGRRPRAAAS